MLCLLLGGGCFPYVVLSVHTSGYYGGDCVDACHLNPCKNKSVCRRKPGSPLGYVCECAGNFFGQYCEHR